MLVMSRLLRSIERTENKGARLATHLNFCQKTTDCFRQTTAARKRSAENEELEYGRKNKI